MACWAGTHGPGLLWGEDPGCLPPSEPLCTANQEGSDKPDCPTDGVGPTFSLPVEVETESARIVRREWRGGWGGELLELRFLNFRGSSFNIDSPF